MRTYAKNATTIQLERIESQLDILERLRKLSGNSEMVVDGSIEAAIHHEIDKLERNGIEP